MSDLTKYIDNIREQFESVFPSSNRPWNNLMDRFSGVEFQRAEDGSKISYYVDVPGCRSEDIQLTQEGSVISVVAERKNRTSRSKMEATWTVDSNLYDVNSLETMLSSGVLTITFNSIRKQEIKPEPRRITIKSMQ